MRMLGNNSFENLVGFQNGSMLNYNCYTAKNIRLYISVLVNFICYSFY